MAGILGRKIGMTNIFNEDGRFISVTVIEAGPCSVLGTRTGQKDGYHAVVLGYEELKASKVKKPQNGWFKKLGVRPKKVIKEIRVDVDPAYKVGETIGANIFKSGDYVDVSGVSIGKGFQGGVKRWNWHGGDQGHGSMFHRAPGSIGASSFPSRVFKGQHLPGHMGNVKKTVQNLEIVNIDPEKHLLIVKGSVPGHRGTLLVVKHAKKKPPKDVPRLHSGQDGQEDAKNKS